MNVFTVAVKASPKETDARKRAMTNDFIRFGAWVYENSRQVIDTMISAAVSNVKARTCHPMVGCSPAAMRVSMKAGMIKEMAVRKRPMDILRKGVSRKNLLMAG